MTNTTSLPSEECGASGYRPWGWAGTWTEFLDLSERDWLISLLRHCQERFLNKVVGQNQIIVWKKEFTLLKRAIAESLETHAAGKDCLIAFEYELPFEDGNRPDVVMVLANGQGVVIEFKDSPKPSSKDYEQAAHYAASIGRYHSESHNLRIVPILWLLKAGSLRAKAALHPDVCIIPGGDSAVPLLRDLLDECFKRDGISIDPMNWLTGGFKPRPDLVRNFIEAYEHSSFPSLQLPEDPTTGSVLAYISSAADQAKTNKSHTLILVPEGPGKTAIALRTVVDEAKQGNDSLYLTGDAFEKAALTDLVRQIDSFHDNKPGLSLIRGMKTFLRYATRSSEESCANFYVFDNTHDRTYLPVTSRSWSKFAEDLLLDAASVREWGAVVVFVSPYYGNLRKELDHWVRALMLCNRHDRSWTVFTPAPAGFEIDDAAMIQVVVEPSLKLSNRPFIEEPKQAESEDIGLSNLQKWKRFRNQLLKELPPEILAMDVIPHEFITKETLTANPEGKDLMCEAALWGHLADFHPDLLTWDMLAWGIERDPGSTPLRGAAKYDHLDQVPPSACVEHYQEAKEIVIAAVHKSQNFGRAERWATARRWLLKVLLHGSTIQPCAIERATLDLQAIAVEAVRSGTAVRISSNFTSLPISSLLEGEDRIAHWLRRYCETKTEDYLDFALTEAYLQEFLPSSEESPE